jgi:hypothetical protein
MLAEIKAKPRRKRRQRHLSNSRPKPAARPKSSHAPEQPPKILHKIKQYKDLFADFRLAETRFERVK